MKPAIVLLLLVTSIALAHAQAAPTVDDFKSHYWTTERKVEVPMLLAATAADAFFTNRNLGKRSIMVAGCRQRSGHPSDCLEVTSGVEQNPFARIFVTHGTAAQVGYFTGLSALTIGGSYLLEKHHHPVAARWLLRVQLGSEIYMAASSGLQ